MESDRPYDISTLCVHADDGADEQYGALVTPIFQTSAFRFPSVEEGARRFATGEGYIYTRLKNPTVRQLELNLARLEHGTAALATATGMAAVTTMYFGLLNAGDHVVGTDGMYAPSRLIMEREFSRFGVACDFVDTSEAENIRKAWKPATKLLFVETPANPVLKVTDLKACADFAHPRGALLAVDNTLLSPILQQPLAHGADVVIHSLTKHVNGHSDALGGVLIVRDAERAVRLRKVLINLGGTMDPHQAWLVLRGLRTLALRVAKSQENAKRIAAYLSGHPKVERVFYPGLPDHPQFELSRRQAKGPGSMISLIIKGGYNAGVALLNALKLHVLAVSLGSIESLVQHPASMTHSGMTAQERAASGIDDGLVRLSVGCEEAQDLLNDLEEGLKKC